MCILLPDVLCWPWSLSSVWCAFHEKSTTAGRQKAGRHTALYTKCRRWAQRPVVLQTPGPQHRDWTVIQNSCVSTAQTDRTSCLPTTVLKNGQRGPTVYPKLLCWKRGRNRGPTVYPKLLCWKRGRSWRDYLLTKVCKPSTMRAEWNPAWSLEWPTELGKCPHRKCEAAEDWQTGSAVTGECQYSLQWPAQKASWGINTSTHKAHVTKNWNSVMDASE